MTSISEGTAVKTDIHGIYRFGGRFKSVLLRYGNHFENNNFQNEYYSPIV
jgi:hypothetical protein